MVNRMYVPTTGPDDWRRLLAEPDKQWRAGYSAHALAHAWEQVDGLPSRVAEVLDKADQSALRGLDLICGLPEYQTPLPGGSRPSQTDLLVLARNDNGLVVIAVEGKAEESFGPLVSEWLKQASPGKERRLAYLCEVLGLERSVVEDLRYQLLHRTASALVEANRLHAQTAVMLVHSFSPNATWFEDFAGFVQALGGEAGRDAVCELGEKFGRTLALGWVSDVAISGETEG